MKLPLKVPSHFYFSNLPNREREGEGEREGYRETVREREGDRREERERKGRGEREREKVS